MSDANPLVPKRRFLIEVAPWGEHLVRVSCKALNVSACGASVEETMTEFLQHLEHFVEYYRGLMPVQCVGLADRLRKRFNHTFPRRHELTAAR